MKNVKNFYEGRNKIIEGFKNNIFPVYYDGTQVVTSESDEQRILESVQTCLIQKVKNLQQKEILQYYKSRIKNTKIKYNQRERRKNK